MNNQLISTVSSYFDDTNQYDEITILANTSAIINQLFPNINWVGFYLYKEGVLKLLEIFNSRLEHLHIVVAVNVLIEACADTLTMAHLTEYSTVG